MKNNITIEQLSYLLNDSTTVPGEETYEIIKEIKDFEAKIKKLEEKLGAIITIIKENTTIFSYIDELYKIKLDNQKTAREIEEKKTKFEQNNTKAAKFNKITRKINGLLRINIPPITCAPIAMLPFNFVLNHHNLVEILKKLENYNPDRKPQYDDTTRRLHEETRLLLDNIETKNVTTKEIIENLYDLNLNIPINASKEEILNALIEEKTSLEKQLSDMKLKQKEMISDFHKKVKTYDEKLQEIETSFEEILSEDSERQETPQDSPKKIRRI